MNNLHFKLGLIALAFPVLLFAQQPVDQSQIEDATQHILNNPPVANTGEPINPELQRFYDTILGQQSNTLLDEDKQFLAPRPGEDASTYINRIHIENLRRTAAGEKTLPDPTVSTTQVPPTPDKTVTPLDAKPLDPRNFAGPEGWIPPTVGTTGSTAGGTSSGRSNTIFDALVPPGMFSVQQPLSVLINQLFYAGLIVAVILAVVMIIVGGVQYMTIDAAAQKDTGKKRVQAALGGLVLSFSAILILNTINPNLTNMSIMFDALKLMKEVDVTGLPITSGSRPETIPPGGSGSGPRIPPASYGSWDEDTADAWVNVLENGRRSTDGRLVVSVYSATGDAVTDTNTAQKRGNANNLLREGSVALSPDLISKYKPKHGSEIFINGISIGFYEDTTASEYRGVPFRNTVDIYDENGSLGSKNILKNIPPGTWNMTFGAPRPQIANP